jgi:hypothetical protein
MKITVADHVTTAAYSDLNNTCAVVSKALMAAHKYASYKLP